MNFLAEGISTTVIGMGIVFIVLIVLSLLISGLDSVAGRSAKQGGEESSQ